MRPESRDGAFLESGNPLRESRNIYIVSMTELYADLLPEQVGMGAGTDQVQPIPIDSVD